MMQMLNRRLILGLLASVTTVGVCGVAFAQRSNPEKGKGNSEASKKRKKHVNGRKALGAKLKQDGRHKVGRAVKAEVEVV